MKTMAEEVFKGVKKCSRVLFTMRPVSEGKVVMILLNLNSMLRQ